MESGEDVQTNNNNHYEIPNKNLFSIIKPSTKTKIQNHFLRNYNAIIYKKINNKKMNLTYVFDACVYC